MGAQEKTLSSVYRQGTKKRFEGPVKPMLPVLVERPFDKRGWVFEIKWDGYRAIAECLGKETKLYSRNGNDFLAFYPPVAKELKEISFEAVFDGEIVVTDNKGRSDFSQLQNYRRTGSGTVVYYVFDLLYYEGFDLTGLPLATRKFILRSVLPSSLRHIKFSNHIEQRGRVFYEKASKFGVEGIIAKDGSSLYTPGTRSRSWNKIKVVNQQEMVVGGFTIADKSENSFRSLLVGVYESGKLIYCGTVGSGFKSEELVEIRKRLDEISASDSPFFTPPDPKEGIRWVQPCLVCVVRFTEWTQAGVMRHPVFLGFREDKDAHAVRRERAETDKQRFSVKVWESRVEVGGNTVILTNTDKIYFPRDGISKGEVIEYYREIAPWILPHLVDRPQSLHRFPDGIGGKEFFHKNIETTPEWIETERVASEESSAESVRYMLCQNEASLIYIVNLGTIEINPWLSRRGRYDFPDYMVIDLDPLQIPFSQVVRTAWAFNSLCNQIGAASYIKTSGATGLHIFVPLNAAYHYEQVRQFAMLCCHAINKKLPDITTIQRSPAHRRGRVYLDYLQNSRGKTMATVYSVRPRNGATVSTPLLWQEVTDKLDPSKFTIRTTLSRVQKRGDLWKPVLGEGADIKKSLSRLGRILFDYG